MIANIVAGICAVLMIGAGLFAMINLEKPGKREEHPQEKKAEKKKN